MAEKKLQCRLFMDQLEPGEPVTAVEPSLVFQCTCDSETKSKILIEIEVSNGSVGASRVSQARISTSQSSIFLERERPDSDPDDWGAARILSGGFGSGSN